MRDSLAAARVAMVMIFSSTAQLQITPKKETCFSLDVVCGKYIFAEKFLANLKVRKKGKESTEYPSS